MGIEYKITLPIRNVPTNAAYRSGNCGWYMTTRARKFKKEAIEIICEQHTGTEPMKGDIKLTVDLMFKAVKASDIDAVKLVIDCLQGIVIEDDKQIMQLRVNKYIETGIDAIELRIEEVKSAQ